MALSDDQKAMLRLLAQREQGYEDLAALMGLSVEEVRAKVKDALAQLEEKGETPPPAPVEAAPAVQPPAPEAEASPAEPLPSPRSAAPQPGPVAPTEPAKPEPARPSRPKVPLPPGGGARAAIVAGALVLIALIAVLALGGGDDGSSDATAPVSGGSTGAGEGTTGATAASGKEITQAILSPVGGGDAKGIAAFGRVKNSLALQLEASGLEPTGNGQSYTVWLYESPQKMLPLASTRVPKSGKIATQVEVPTEVLAYLANETFDQIDISLTSDATLKASLAKATKEKKAPLYTGTDVLRGKITGPIVGAASR